MSEQALSNLDTFSLTDTKSAASVRAPSFTKLELKRVGTAATMIVVLGTSIILLMLVLMGHYNSLAHSFPKAVMDGAVIALLIGRRARWRCLGLLGVVYGLVLVLQLGVVYLFPVIALAGLIASLVGRTANWIDRTFAVLLAAATYELLAGFAGPIKIYFGTDGRNEPFVWAMWFMEWPLRVSGAMIGAGMATRWAAKRKALGNQQSVVSGEVVRSSWISPAAANPSFATTPLATAPLATTPLATTPFATTPFVTSTSANPSFTTGPSSHNALPSHGGIDRSIRVRGVGPAGVRVAIAGLGCVVPMTLSSTWLLALFAVSYIVYAIAAGLRWRVLHAVLGLVWGWAVFSVLSYLWNHDPHRVIDMLRSFVLRFAPLALGAMVLVATVRPVDVIRLLRNAHVGGFILIPLSHVVRSVPQARREILDGIARLRASGQWRGPWSVVRHPRAALRELITPLISKWGQGLVEA